MKRWRVDLIKLDVSLAESQQTGARYYLPGIGVAYVYAPDELGAWADAMKLEENHNAVPIVR